MTVMWEFNASTSHGRVTSVRSIIAYALATLLMSLLLVTLTPSATHAADATWSEDAIIYEENSYSGPGLPVLVEDLGLAEGTTVFTYLEPEPQTASERKLHVIYFAPGADPGSANRAQYRTYTYEGPGDFTNGSPMVGIDIEPLAVTTGEGTSSCQVDGGLGWIICPLTNTLASWMDWVFDMLVGFLEVRPLDTGQDSAMYRMWAYMRTFANIAFVVAALVIIYSQLTSFGITNYGIKKLLPRIIVAAILVNLSYIICSIAIDLSNILGHSLQSLFLELRNTAIGPGGNSWEPPTWSSVATFILTGGTAVATGSVLAVSGVATYGVIGALALLLPTLVTVLISVFVAIVVMAARQALITILTIISPIAFVAYLLPNTEKWFDRWRSTFMTMLVLFPAFSVIFGGSQLAGAMIIQNASSINVMILGMAVQVAPLFVTPMLIKLSGGLISRVAGLMNDPNRGVIDRTRNFAKETAEDKKVRRLGTPAPNGWRGAAQRTGQRLDHNRRRREGWRNAYGAVADANWANSQGFSDIDQVNRTAAEEKTLGETRSATRYSDAKTTNTELRQLDVNVRHAKAKLENAELHATVENWDKNNAPSILSTKLHQRTLKDVQEGVSKRESSEYEEIRAGVVPSRLSHVPSIISYTAVAREALTSTKISTDRTNNALAKQAEEYAQLLQSNSGLTREAGGIRGTQGYMSVLAAAKKTASKFLVEEISNIQDTLDYKVATDVEALHQKFSSSTTMAERVAYANAIANNGGPGIGKLRDVFREYERTQGLAPEDLLDFKELVGSNSSIRASGKDIEFWLSNSRDPVTNKSRSFDEVAYDIKTWTNLSAEAFAAQSVATHHFAFEVLYRQDRENYNKIIESIRTTPSALAQVKQGIKDRFAIYSEEEIEGANEKGIILRKPGEPAPGDSLLNP